MQKSLIDFILNIVYLIISKKETYWPEVCCCVSCKIWFHQKALLSQPIISDVKVNSHLHDNTTIAFNVFHQTRLETLISYILLHSGGVQ